MTKAFVEFIGKVAEPGVLSVMAIVPLADEMGAFSLEFCQFQVLIVVACRYESAEFCSRNMAQPKVQQHILSPCAASMQYVPLLSLNRFIHVVLSPFCDISASSSFAWTSMTTDYERCDPLPSKLLAMFEDR